MKKLIIILAISIISINVLKAQYSIRDSSVSFVMISPHYSFMIPNGDLSERFGNNSNIGASLMYKTKRNWLLGTDFNFIFGNQVYNKDSILKNIQTSQGSVIDGNGEFAEIYFYERGFYSTVKVGKIFNILTPNPNSGFVVTAGVGLFQHKIRIENTDKTAPQIIDDYTKGYDKLTNGLCLNEFVGYQFFSNSRLVNFYFGFEFLQSWTQSRRDYDFVLKGKDETERLDLLNGVKFGWVIPFYPRKPKEFYYY